MKVEYTDMRILSMTDDLPFHKSLTVNELSGGFFQLKGESSSGYEQVTILEEGKLKEAIDYFNETGRDDVHLCELWGYLIKRWGATEFISFINETKQTKTMVSRGYVVFLLQEMLGCSADRVDAISCQAIASVFGLGAKGSEYARQVRRYRHEAQKHTLKFIKQHCNGASNEAIRLSLFNFVKHNLQKAIAFVTERKKLISANAPLVKGTKLLSRLQSDLSSWLESAVNKICGHIFQQYLSANNV